MKNNKADITFTSPPYNLLQVETNLTTMDYYTDNGLYSNYNDNLSNDEYTNLLTTSAKNALKYTDDILYNIGITRGSKIGLIQFLNNLKENLSDIIIWKKGSAIPLGLESQKHKISHICELIFCFNKNGDRNFKHSQWQKGTMNNIITTKKKQLQQPNTI